MGGRVFLCPDVTRVQGGGSPNSTSNDKKSEFVLSLGCENQPSVDPAKFGLLRLTATVHP